MQCFVDATTGTTQSERVNVGSTTTGVACHFDRSITGFTLEKGSFRGRPIWSIQQAKAGVVRSPACECSSAFSLHPLHHRTDRRTGRHGTIERAGCMPPTWPDLSCRRRRRDRCERKRRMGPGATPECMADSSDIIRARARAFNSSGARRLGLAPSHDTNNKKKPFWRGRAAAGLVARRADGGEAAGDTGRSAGGRDWALDGAGVNSQQWPSGRLQACNSIGRAATS